MFTIAIHAGFIFKFHLIKALFEFVAVCLPCALLRLTAVAHSALSCLNGVFASGQWLQLVLNMMLQIGERLKGTTW